MNLWILIFFNRLKSITSTDFESQIVLDLVNGVPSPGSVSFWNISIILLAVPYFLKY